MKQILLVDDSRTILAEIKALLSGEEYSVTPVASGAQALKYLSVKTPDLIISDVLMPEMDGFSLISEIRREGFADIPVMLMTADTSEDSKLRCIEAGAEDFIAKPIVPAVLKRRVARIMELSELKKSSAEG